MKYLSTKEIALKWGISMRSVQSFCQNGKIPGAKNLGKQWMIPADSVRPSDSRFKNSRSGATAYIFPLFIYSPAYSYGNDLNPNEYALFMAQIKMLEGDYPESIRMCREVLNTDPPIHLMMGAYYTIAHCSMTLGNYYEHKKALAAMESIAHSHHPYSEDYKLLTYSIKRYIGWNNRIYDNIDILKLSPDARYFYQYECMVSIATGNEQISKDTLHIYDALALQISSEGIAPLDANIRFALASLHIRSYDSMSEEHIETACKISISRNWIHILAKNLSLAKTIIKKSLDRNTPGYYRKVAEMAERDYNNWRIINRQESGIYPFENFSQSDISVLFMIYQGLSNKEICAIMNLSSKSLRNILSNCYKTAKVNNRNELRKYTVSQLSTWFED